MFIVMFDVVYSKKFDSDSIYVSSNCKIKQFLIKLIDNNYDYNTCIHLLRKFDDYWNITKNKTLYESHRLENDLFSIVRSICKNGRSDLLDYYILNCKASFPNTHSFYIDYKDKFILKNIIKIVVSEKNILTSIKNNNHEFLKVIDILLINNNRFANDVIDHAIKSSLLNNAVSVKNIFLIDKVLELFDKDVSTTRIPINLFINIIKNCENNEELIEKLISHKIYNNDIIIDVISNKNIDLLKILMKNDVIDEHYKETVLSLIKLQ